MQTKLGCHISVRSSLEGTRLYAKQLGLDIFQTGWANMTSNILPVTLLGRPVDEFPRDYNLTTDPIWVLHSAYPVHCTPKDSGTAYTSANYLKVMFRHARAIGATFIVVHTGGTKDKEAQSVTDSVHKFLRSYGILSALEEINKSFPLTLVVENVAAAYSFNQDLTNTTKAIEGLPHVGWVLDLAHANAAGVSDSNLWEVIEKSPPLICHANYPGSDYASGLDRHGWRHLANDDEDVMSGRRQFWDDTVKLLSKKQVPLILEGSSSMGSMDREISFVRGLLTINNKD